ncbi:thioredoxin domain [Serratia phage 92A1]|nr:thioredoxin domain [Serratia phage 92A1]
MIVIYGFDPAHFNCVPCVNAKRYCEAKKLEYVFRPITKGVAADGQVEVDDDVLTEMFARQGVVHTPGKIPRTTFPQIFHEREGEETVRIGGFDQLRTYKFI